MKEDQERVRALLTDTVTLLCTNGLSFQRNLRVQGLIGITLDDDEVFIVQINETLSGGSTVSSVGSNNSSDTLIQSRTKVPQSRNCIDQLSPRTVSEISESSAILANFPTMTKNDVDECAVITNEELPSIVAIKPEPVEVINVDEPSLKVIRREQHFRKYFKKPFDKRNKFSDFYINSRRGKSDFYANRVRRIASLNAAGLAQTDFLNIDNGFSQTVSSNNEHDAGYSDITEAFNSSGGAVFTNNSNIYLEDSWDYQTGHENSLDRNLSDLSTEQIIHNSHLDVPNAGSAHTSTYPISSNISKWLPISRRPVDSNAKQFVCDYEGCTLAYYERKNLLQHQSLKHGRPSLRAHMKRSFWSPNQSQ